MYRANMASLWADEARVNEQTALYSRDREISEHVEDSRQGRHAKVKL